MQQTKERKTAGKVDDACSIQWCQFRTEHCCTVAPARESPATYQLDRAGQMILSMLHNAANFAEGNYQHALDTAQKLSHQLHAAEARIAELEAVGQTCQERAERAEQWLHRVYAEIQDRFLRQDQNARRPR